MKKFDGEVNGVAYTDEKSYNEAVVKAQEDGTLHTCRSSFIYVSDCKDESESKHGISVADKDNVTSFAHDEHANHDPEKLNFAFDVNNIVNNINRSNEEFNKWVNCLTSGYDVTSKSLKSITCPQRLDQYISDIDKEHARISDLHEQNTSAAKRVEEKREALKKQYAELDKQWEDLDVKTDYLNVGDDVLHEIENFLEDCKNVAQETKNNLNVNKEKASPYTGYLRLLKALFE